MIGIIAAGTTTAASETLDNRAVSDAVELSQRAYSLCLGSIQLAYAAGLGVYAVSSQPGEGSRATARERLEGNQTGTGDLPFGPLVAEASNRFGVPQRWIRAVMQVESGGEALATSPKGAMGLMQVMPDTYAGLRDQYGLDGDPYAARDNVLAGAAYIRELYDRYGSPGFIAAYNAGPGRYDDYLTQGRELPEETLHYIASVGAALGEDFGGQVFGKLPPRRQTVPRFHEPISISDGGELLLRRTGQPVPLTDRLALHGLLARAIGLPAAR